jgi:pimeloyl-ACP methyl ester carboxylesterase
LLQESFTRRQSMLGLLWGASIFSSTTECAANPAKRMPNAVRQLATWLTLPPTPVLPDASRHGLARINGTAIFFAQFGKGRQLLLLHGGLANSNYWGNQIIELSQNFSVTVMDTRGHGRSPVTSSTFSYSLFASDVIGLLDYLDISRTAIVGWSDGAITGIQLAMTRPDRLSGLFAYGANTTLEGLKAGGAKAPVFETFASRCRKEYSSLSPHSERWPELQQGLSVMWRTEPNFTRQQLAKIKLPVTISDGEYDEIIKPEHTKQIASDIPNARLSILPDVSHFAMLQNPAQFNGAIHNFLLSNG